MLTWVIILTRYIARGVRWKQRQKYKSIRQSPKPKKVKVRHAPRAVSVTVSKTVNSFAENFITFFTWPNQLFLPSTKKKTN